mmetsp:Transcript_113304/g.360172  ORF Transcript_113304/g.360172 Transcript_113304/m.360172 type:complete len:579 (-) Transcript_113304:85-1821(-)
MGLQPIILYAADFAAVLVSLSVVGSACAWLGEQHKYGSHTHAQVALAIALCFGFSLWVAAEVEAKIVQTWGTKESYAAVPAAAGAEEAGIELPATKIGNAVEGPSSPGAKEVAWQESTVSTASAPSSMLEGAREPLRSVAELAGIVAFLYLCDRTAYFPDGKKVYSPAAFWGCWGLICLAALATTRRLESTQVMQREQTDEWKGWMQIMFLMYHYFAEHEVYNAIRIYIAAYVWMTGYGNFFLYARGKSFTIRRTLQMLFRLNFLGLVVCVALNNEYMLYYICAMHTFFTVVVVLALYIKSDANTAAKAVYSKIALTLVVTLLIYDGPEFIFKAIFGVIPGMRQLFAFHDPLHKEFTNELHEWHFRSGLDRFIWIVGMVYAFEVGRFEAFMQRLDGIASLAKRYAARAGVALLALAVGGLWWHYAFRLGKYKYNAVHPYTSFVPLTVFLVLRNLFPPIRQRYMWLFAFLGKVTLETYIFQFHIWMKTTGVNGSPRTLMVWIPGWHYVNMVLTTAVYVFLSFRMFHITDSLKNAMIPEALASTAKRLGAVSLLGAACYGASFAFVGPYALVVADKAVLR